jgi:anti-anti-sigma factor
MAAGAARLHGVGAITSRVVHEGCAVVQVRGDVQLREARRVEAEVIRLVGRGCRCFALDLRQVTHVGAGLLGAVLRIRRGLGALDGRLVLVGSQPALAELVEVAALRLLVEVVEDQAEALALLDGWSGGHAGARPRARVARCREGRRP